MVQTGRFRAAVGNSMLVSTAATVLSVGVAYLLAFTVNRCNIPFKNLLSVLAVLPMLIPSVSHGLGLINLLGQNGILARVLSIDMEIYGFSGVLMGSVLYSFPVAFLMLSDAMSYADMSLYETAEVLGIPRLCRFASITMQYMRRPLISAVFAVFTMVFTDYGVPLAIGGRFVTLPVYLYTEVIGLLDFSKGAFIGAILLLPAIVSFVIDLRKNKAEAMGFSPRKIIIKRNHARDWVCGSFSFLFIGGVCAVLLSFAFIAVIKKYPTDLSFTTYHIANVLKKGATRYLGNSLLISLTVGVLGTTIGYIIAYITSRTRATLVSRILHLSSISSLAIPGIVLGLGYIICFRSSFIYGTLLILVLVNIIHFFSSPYLMACNAIRKLNSNYEDVGATLGVGVFRLLRDVFIPNTLGTIVEMFQYFFVNSMITISATAFLYTTRTMPLAIMINELQGNMMFEAAAFVSFLILLFNILIKLLSLFIKRLCGRLYSAA